MTVELKNKIKNELNRAFSYMGEIDHETLDEKVESELDTLMCLMVGSEPDVIHTITGDITGYIVDIATTADNATNNIIALQMVITKDSICYVLNSYTATRPDGWEPGDAHNICNELNRIVNLDDIDPTMFY